MAATPTDLQTRAYEAVIRLGSQSAAAKELEQNRWERQL